MSESTEPTITPAQVAEFQRNQRAKEEQAMQACIADLQALAAQRGYTIVGVPQLIPDERGSWALSVAWGVRCL